VKFHEGDEVIVRGDPAPNQGWMSGQKYIIDYWLDPDGEDPKPAYELKLEYFGSVGWAYEDQLELSMTAADRAKRKLPTAKDIIETMGPDSWHSWEGDFMIDETDIAGENKAIEFYGRTKDGLRFGARMKVTRIWETDY
jgi:hypothetical protein